MQTGIEFEFQSLIGTVQQALINDHAAIVRQIVFQSLIGTVQQQYLLRFLFSLYPIFPVFQPFSPKKSVNLFIVNSRKALILVCYPSSRQLKKAKNIFCPVLCRAAFMLLPADAFHNTPVELRYKDFFVPAYLCNNLYILQLLLSVRP